MNTIKFLAGFILLVLFAHSGVAQNSFVYSYDNAGNQVQRTIQINFGARFGSFGNPKDSLLPLPGFKLFPNPTNQVLNLEGRLPEKVKAANVRLMNVSGQLLKTDVYYGEPRSLNVSDLKDGLYILDLSWSEKERMSYKIIITH